MSVAAGKTEGTDTSICLVRRPGDGLLADLEPIKVQRAIDGTRQRLARNGAVTKDQQNLDQTGQPGTHQRVANDAFRGAQIGVVRLPLSTKAVDQPRHLNRIPQACARTVGLNVTDTPHVNPATLVGTGDQRRLGLAVGRHHAIAHAVVIQADRLDACQYFQPQFPGLAGAHQHDCRHALRRDETVGFVTEGVTVPSRR
ncbi:hypothetical protein D3C80_971290 [compost metagenome]